MLPELTGQASMLTDLRFTEYSTINSLKTVYEKKFAVETFYREINQLI
jgi:hypothetical protein